MLQVTICTVPRQWNLTWSPATVGRSKVTLTSFPGPRPASRRLQYTRPLPSFPSLAIHQALAQLPVACNTPGPCPPSRCFQYAKRTTSNGKLGEGLGTRLKSPQFWFWPSTQAHWYHSPNVFDVATDWTYSWQCFNLLCSSLIYSTHILKQLCFLLLTQTHLSPLQIRKRCSKLLALTFLTTPFRATMPAFLPTDKLVHNEWSHWSCLAQPAN